MLVHLRHLQLVFEVRTGAQTLDDRGQPARLDEIDHQALTGLDPQIRQVRGRLGDHRDALVEIEHALLIGVHQNRHHDLVELRSRTLEDVDMAKGHRVEGAGAYRATHG